jgi:hypothetical protein
MNKRQVIHKNQGVIEYWCRTFTGWKPVSESHALKTWTHFDTVIIEHSNKKVNGLYGFSKNKPKNS